MKKILTVMGTRPEAIKLIPLYKQLALSGFESLLCAAFQHGEMLEQVISAFKVTPDFNLNVMEQGQDLFHITGEVLRRIKPILISSQPNLIIIQGDTTTALATALAGFYLKIPICHVEAGLRTGSIEAPFPEEMNRKVIGIIASYHCAATPLNVGNLLSEGIKRERIILSGNTVVDSLDFIKKEISQGHISVNATLTKLVQKLSQENKKIILLTAHRRESFNGGLENIFRAVQDFLAIHDDVAIIYPHHPNPHVLQALEKTLFKDTPGVHFFPPFDYPSLIYSIISARWVATDSGGIQEEATSLGKPVIILRELTERIEAVWEGIAFIAGTNQKKIFHNLNHCYAEKITAKPSSIYGDGQASKKIAGFIERIFSESSEKGAFTCSCTTSSSSVSTG